MKRDYVLCVSDEGYHRVAYTEWGKVNSESPTVICVHGLTRNSRDFDALADYLSTQGSHVFCPDVVGRGDSSWLKNAHDYNFKRYIIDLSNLISRTGAKEIDWIGTSMGGLLGIIMASLPNTPIRRLILNDVSPQVPIQTLWHMAKYVGKDPQFSSKEEAKEHYKKIYAEFGNLTEKQWINFTEHSVTELSPGVFISKFDPNIHDFKLSWQSVKEFLYHPHRALEGILFDIDLWDFWQKITCPVLVIRGSRSTLLLPEHIKKMKRMHPEVEVFEVEDAGHAPALLELDQHKKIRSWLNGKKISDLH
ncbi:hydrolase/acyltransferase [Legionella nautarum]|uniref:Hydrolase/acyltransferase n=1 Tax=Legionella nautarum TaxID=45070 RepID=A0A0W0WV19_9GAMM|nr:alpha/beta hydrolase [Legionella nautarum]KTD36155.1 hydrolase/acyltransferase [Legionella nautarum]